MSVNTIINFQANFSCFIGLHAIVLGEALYVIEDVNGLQCLYVTGDDEDPLAHLTKDDVRELAGMDIFAFHKHLEQTKEERP